MAAGQEYIDVGLEETLRVGRVDLCDWAWFTLGWQGATLPLWLELEMRIDSGQFDEGRDRFQSLSPTTYYLNRALSILEDQLPDRVTQFWSRRCIQLDGVNKDDCCSLNEDRVQNGYLNNMLIAKDLARQIQSLCSTIQIQRLWLDFGYELGLLYHHELDHDEKVEDTADKVIKLCAKVFQSVRHKIPIMKQISQLEKRAIESIENFACRLCVAMTSDENQMGLYQIASCALFRAVPKLVGHIADNLLRGRPKPLWVIKGGTGRLYYKDRVVRTIPRVQNATGIKKVLDVFTEENWSDTIYCPLKNKRLALHNTLYQLRKDLDPSLAFRATECGDRIEWYEPE